jgi:hypothetical protein
MATTPQTVITNSLIVLGVCYPGQVPSPSMLANGLTSMNNMLLSWSVDRGIIYGILKQLFPLTTTVNSYTIGATGTFAGTRPNSIVSATLVIPTGQRFKLRLLTTEEWSDIVDQADASTVPRGMYDDYEYPNSTLYFYPTPTFGSGTTNVELQTWQELETFVTLADDFDMPPGYERAVTYNLAQELSTTYGRPMSQEDMMTATSSLGLLKTVNVPTTHGLADEAVARGQIAQAAGPMAGDVVMPVKR